VAPAFSYESSFATHSIAGTFGRSGGGGLRGRVSTPGRSAGRSITPRRNPPESPLGGADTDHIEKAFVFAGMPARNGVTAALLVQIGLERRG